MNKLKGIDFEFDDLDVDTQGTVLTLGIVTMLKKILLVLLLILCIALVLWFNKLTIFIVAIQTILLLVVTRTQKYLLNKAVKQILKE
ncbi:hypothetical protein P7D52_07995 [Enterococcus dongliensis]|uniref:Uncharacterized protein n=1 Tax=Enterococcus dongliensis TaxID=2559925 RepID=A0AAW8TH81_9ENTE|nr:hypothetical protein [Enterococcus dongliensis]MDT2635690.1 hypothetical protein [Enterococcus dongliensis]MDT2637654.1 hypothetical protein [Enterococcus dongliensis]MDT2642726.1 hypothetical protein [Enterococcus dongliensis]